MAKAPQTAITPTRADDYPEWYQQVVRAADLADARRAQTDAPRFPRVQL